jgi:hypothetical protein
MSQRCIIGTYRTKYMADCVTLMPKKLCSSIYISPKPYMLHNMKTYLHKLRDILPVKYSGRF